MKKISLKIPYAEKEGEIVHVSRVDRGLQCNCVCPVCKGAVIARKGEIIRHHFAHHGESSCSPESVFHLVAKKLLYNRIEKQIKHAKALPIKWECVYCREEHSGNLLKKASTVTLETKIGDCRPDLIISDADGKPLAFIEIVVTHEPEENVVEYCNNNKITLVYFKIRNARDLLALDIETPLRPRFVDLCRNPQCDICGSVLTKAELHIINTSCRRCGFDMKTAVVSSCGNIAGPEVLSTEHIKMAEDEGVYISHQYSHTSQRSYYANTCPSCGTFIGAPYLRYFSALIREKQGHEVENVCMKCLTKDIPNIS